MTTLADHLRKGEPVKYCLIHGYVPVPAAANCCPKCGERLTDLVEHAARMERTMRERQQAEAESRLP